MLFYLLVCNVTDEFSELKKNGRILTYVTDATHVYTTYILLKKVLTIFIFLAENL